MCSAETVQPAVQPAVQPGHKFRPKTSPVTQLQGLVNYMDQAPIFDSGPQTFDGPLSNSNLKSVLGLIEASSCDQTLIFQQFLRATKLTVHCTAPVSEFLRNVVVQSFFV